MQKHFSIDNLIDGFDDDVPYFTTSLGDMIITAEGTIRRNFIWLEFRESLLEL